MNYQKYYSFFATVLWDEEMIIDWILIYWCVFNSLSDVAPVRLSDGKHPKEGRVEIYHDGQWGTICDDAFDLNDAKAVCASLGYK